MRYKLFLTLSLLLASCWLPAQVKRVTDANKQKQNTDISLRAKSFIESSTGDRKDVAWVRIIYRELDLTKGSNASLYYPEDPIDGQPNLFRLIMTLMSDGKLDAYEYLDGREIFTDKYKLKVKDMLDRFHILYEEKAVRGTQHPVFVIDDSDVPCNEVQSYYIKEKWMFDQRSSMFTSQIEAICPILHRSGDFGGDVTKYPMFWVPYEKIRPYLTQYQVMSDGMNNAMRYTFDDFFVLRKYDGKIYKTMNLRNQSLMQQYPNADSLKLAQEKIDCELNNFEQSLWIPSDEAINAKENVSKENNQSVKSEKQEKKSSSRSVRSSRSRKSESSSENKSEKATQAPIRSVRRTR